MLNMDKLVDEHSSLLRITSAVIVCIKTTSNLKQSYRNSLKHGNWWISIYNLHSKCNLGLTSSYYLQRPGDDLKLMAIFANWRLLYVHYMFKIKICYLMLDNFRDLQDCSYFQCMKKELGRRICNKMCTICHIFLFLIFCITDVKDIFLEYYWRHSLEFCSVQILYTEQNMFML